MLAISNTVEIPDEEFEITFARSGGPGGQNVNKVNSKAVLRWNVAASQSIPFGVRNRFLAKFANRLTSDGSILVTSQKTRDQGQNVEDCREKLREMILQVLTPATIRRETRPTLASVKRRTESKRLNSAKKQNRRSPKGDF
ncbi:MAG: aminoacyl-tRNA hydrolase [Candidatus Obscuribacterales bacterium]|nr:aminoacyl-tRNA hydrolase [Candidatus Obscuribacterales bacterium]